MTLIISTQKLTENETSVSVSVTYNCKLLYTLELNKYCSFISGILQDWNWLSYLWLCVCWWNMDFDCWTLWWIFVSKMFPTIKLSLLLLSNTTISFQNIHIPTTVKTSNLIIGVNIFTCR